MESSKEMIVVGGPNGAGKTTFVRQLQQAYPYPYLGTDAIAAELATDDDVASVQIEAGRQFLSQVRNHIDEAQSCIVESTLSGRTFLKELQRAKHSEFTITILFVYVGDAEMSLARVRQRVRMGGHHVPESDVRRRFLRSLSNFWRLYRNVADLWGMVYNGGSEFLDVAVGEGSSVTIYDQTRFDEFIEAVR